MPSLDAVLLGARLDEDHVPETNGWMPVCRRCGAYTDNPEGRQHVPSDQRLDRAQAWLDAHSGARRREETMVAVKA